MIRWSANLKYRKFAVAMAAAFYPWTYIFWLGFACVLVLGFSPTNEFSTPSFLADVAGYFLFMAGLGVFLMPWVILRKVKKLAKATMQQYTLDDDRLTIEAGKDALTLPRDQLRVVFVGTYFIIVRRGRNGMRQFVLLFDDAADLGRVLEELKR